MNIYIYDVEVFQSDWIVVAKSIEQEDEPHIVIHNNNHELRQFLLTDGLLLGGFNNKHYDDAIIHAIWHGADPATVKRLNDFIISGNRWWEFPFLQYKRKEFRSFDLRDDLPINLSLKAIEGHLGQSIVETGVDFNINRKLTDDEIAETIEYCKTDVSNTLLLYEKRKNYLESKKTVARLKGMDEAEAMSLTNAKLTARFLDAKYREYGDEMEYVPPKELQLGKYKHVLQFYMDPVQYTLHQLERELAHETRKVRQGTLKRRIENIKQGDRYDCKLSTQISDVPHVYAWGGIHGAIANYFKRADDKHKIVTIDVGSYYPSMMLEYNYISRSIPSAEGYADIYHKRMHAKQTGDKATSDALKLVLNTCYGAMKNKYNDLYDPRNASAICITGQLLLTDLIDKLESVAGFELIQSNTDGLIIRYPVANEDDIVKRVTEWEKRTRMTMEYTDIHAIAQKDVNNYVMKAGAVYYYENDKKVITEEDEGKLKMKGGYVSLAKGGDFVNNSLVVVHDALVNYLMDGVPIEDTIRNNNNVLDYQIIAKTGSTYDETYHDVGNKRVPVQNVNRVFATNDKRYGTVYKTKKNGREDKIANLPDHCIIDNEGRLTIDQIDKSFYIEMAKKRVEDYIGEQVVTIKKKTGGMSVTDEVKTFGRRAYYYDPESDEYHMFEKGDPHPEETERYEKITKANYEAGIREQTEITAEEPTEEKSITKEDEKMTAAPTQKLNIYQKINKIRIEFLQANVKKTGINRFAGFKYFELADIVPVVLPIMDKYNITHIFSFDEEYATLTLVDNESGRDDEQSYPPMDTYDTVVFKSPMRKLSVKGMNEIQALGGVETYQRRYLYMMFLDIVEADIFDATNGQDEAPADKQGAVKTPTRSNRPATPTQRNNVKNELINEDGKATDLQIRSIKNGLKKLRAQDDSQEDYIKDVVLKIKAGLGKKEAEDLLISISNKIG